MAKSKEINMRLPALDDLFSTQEERDEVRRVIAIDREGKAIPPCGACRELMTQLMPENYRNIEIMMDYEKNRVVTLGELTPEWWI